MSMSAAEPAVRKSKRERIVNLFAQDLGKRHGSRKLHAMFGSSFRTRVSEINRDSDCPIQILNETVSADDGETSVYWGEARPTHAEARSLFGDITPVAATWRDPEER